MASIELTVLEHRLPEFQSRLAKLNRRATRLGVPELVAHKGEQTEIQVWLDRGDQPPRGMMMPAVVIQIEGEAPRLPGWTLAARLEAVDSGTLVHTVPGIEGLEERWRSADPRHCDHCAKERRRRDTLVVIEEQTGRQLQVGRTCLRDFLGHDPARALGMLDLLARAHQLADEESEQSLWIGPANIIPQDEALARTWQVVLCDGWTPRSAGLEHSTADTVGSVFSLGRSRAEFLKTYGPLTEDHERRAQETLRWVREELEVGRSEYTHNLKTLLQPGQFLQHRHLGLACSAVVAHQRALAREEEIRLQREQAPVSQHVGEVGERLRQHRVRVIFMHPFESQYGVGTLVKMVTENGSVLVWSTGGCPGLEIGDEVMMNMTVKAHTEWQGRLETRVTRCRVLGLAKPMA